MSINFKYKPDGQTLKEFMKSDDFFRGLRGPVGSGKSVSCCIEIFRRSLLQQKNPQGVRKSRWAVIRNTNPQLRTTTIKTWLDWFPEDTWGNFAWSVPYTHRILKNDLDIDECRVNCRMNQVNTYLDKIVNKKQDHINFI